MVQQFYFGGFTRGGPAVGWDGTNETDVVDWINAQSSGPGWAVDSVTTTVLTLSYDNGVRILAVPAGSWVSGSGYYVNVVADDGRYWKTSDQWGRPENVADLEAP